MASRHSLKTILHKLALAPGDLENQREGGKTKEEVIVLPGYISLWNSSAFVGIAREN